MPAGNALQSERILSATLKFFSTLPLSSHHRFRLPRENTRFQCSPSRLVITRFQRQYRRMMKDPSKLTPSALRRPFEFEGHPFLLAIFGWSVNAVASRCFIVDSCFIPTFLFRPSFRERYIRRSRMMVKKKKKRVWKWLIRHICLLTR